jgi:hypothetical protein
MRLCAPLKSRLRLRHTRKTTPQHSDFSVVPHQNMSNFVKQKQNGSNGMDALFQNGIKVPF